MNRNFLLVVVFLCIGHLVSGQVKVRPADSENLTPSNLVYDVFLGKGVEVLSVEYDGESYSLGYFQEGMEAVGLDRGIIMTTGKASEVGNSNQDDDTQSGSSDLKYTDSDLSAAVGGLQLSDICRYEIEFIPFTDSILFRYVFASEEYPEYSCSEFNDAFGFFITGPNPQGGSYQAQNIALVPGTQDVVSIENIHPAEPSNDCKAKNEEYYNPNPIGSNTMIYDGYIDVFTASANVIPCEEYKIKLVIADVSDNLYDSGVFLDAKSFSSDILQAKVITPSFDKTISEGCAEATVKFSFDNNVEEDFKVNLRILSDNSLGNIAIKDVDYEISQNTGIIPSGTKSLAFDIFAFEDNMNEEEELIAIEYQRDFCNLDTIYIYILDNQLSFVEMPSKIDVCAGQPKNVNAKFPDGYELPKNKYYKNSKNYSVGSSKGSQVIAKLQVDGVHPNILGSEIINEVCIERFFTQVLDDIEFYLISPEFDTLELSTNNGHRPNGAADMDSMINTCFNQVATTNINNGNPNLGEYFASNPNYTGKYKPEGKWNNLNGGTANGYWQLMIVNENGGYSSELQGWGMSFKTDYDIKYNWSPNSNISCTDCLSPDISPTASTNYFLELEDNYGCTFKDTIFAEVNESEVVKNLSCDSIAVDFIRFAWHRNNAEEKYEVWNSKEEVWKETSENFHELSSLEKEEVITFKVRVKDSECTNEATETQCTTYPCPPPQISIISQTDVSCFGKSDGTISLAASGTLAPYDYRLGNDKNQTGYFDNLPKGTSTIYIMDSDSCEIPFVINIGGPDSIALNYNFQNISCNGKNDGYIELSANGGTGNLNYYWTNNFDNTTFSSNNIYALSSGKYYIKVTDANSCTKEDSIVITEPDLIRIKDSLVHIECKGTNTGEIIIDVTGGVEDYTFDWETPVGKLETKNLIDVPAGIYKLTVTDANGCTADDIFILTEPDNGFEINYTVIDSMCSGEKKGMIRLDIPNPSNYTINWSTGESGITELNNLGEGFYQVTITSKDGCEKIYSENIIELDTIELLLTQDPATCYGYRDGKVGVEEVRYGTRPANLNDFSFEWNTNPVQTGRFAYALKGGETYTVLATNRIGCKQEKSISVGNPLPVEIILKNKSEVSCYGLADGSVYLDKSGTVGNYSFKWSDNANAGDQPYATDLKADIYTVSLTDENGCEDIKSYIISEPQPIQLTFNTSDVKCHNGSDGKATVIVEGGIAPYIYSWENTLKNVNNIVELPSGNYKVTVTDLNGCQEVDSVIISEPKEAISTNIETIAATCFGGSDGEILINSMGGSPPYSNKVEGGKFYNGNKLIGIPGGNYTVIISDVNGCLDTVKNVAVGQAEEINIDINFEDIVNYGSRVLLESNISNAVEPIIYNWDVPQGVWISCDSCSQTEVDVFYDILVKLNIVDANGCTSEISKNIFVKLNNGIFVPTAINPSSDNHSNSKLFVYGKEGIKILSFSVYDKWGTEIYNRENFDINEENKGWDGTFNGKNLEQGVYAWKLNIKHIDGTTQILKGYVTLIR